MSVQLVQLIVSLILFLGGIVILGLRIPGWSLFLGLPSIQIGLIFTIFTLDDLARNKIGPNSLQKISCSVCGKPNLVPHWQKVKKCRRCQEKMIKQLEKEKE